MNFLFSVEFNLIERQIRLISVIVYKNKKELISMSDVHRNDCEIK